MPKQEVAADSQKQALSLGTRIKDLLETDMVAGPAQVAKTFQSGVNALQRIDGFEKQNICHFGFEGMAIFVVFGLLRSILVNAVNMLERKQKREMQKKFEDSIAFELLSIKKIRDGLNKKEQPSLEEEHKKLLNWLYEEDTKKLRQLFPDIQIVSGIDLLEDLIQGDEGQKKSIKRVIRNRLLNEMRSQEELWFNRLVIACFALNTFVYSLFAAKSGYIFVLYCAVLCGTAGSAGILPVAFILAAVMFLGSGLTSQNAISGGISKDCRDFCDFLRSLRSGEPKLERVHLVYAFVAACTVATGPLLYVALLPLCIKFLMLMHIASSTAAPFAMGIIIPMVVITVLYAIRLAWSQVKTLKEKFSELFGPGSLVYKMYQADEAHGRKDRVWLYWVWIAVGAIIISAVIATGVLGDIFGISKILPSHWSVLVAAGVMSLVCNILLNIDFVHRMPDCAEKLGKWISSFFSKKELDVPDNEASKPSGSDTSSVEDKAERASSQTVADGVTLFRSFSNGDMSSLHTATSSTNFLACPA